MYPRSRPGMRPDERMAEIRILEREEIEETQEKITGKRIGTNLGGKIFAFERIGLEHGISVSHVFGKSIEHSLIKSKNMFLLWKKPGGRVWIRGKISDGTVLFRALLPIGLIRCPWN